MSKRGLQLYKSYSFVDKDPVIDVLRTAIADEGANYITLHENSGVATSTMYNWFRGTTRKPQFATVAAIASAMGYSGYDWSKRQFWGRKTAAKVIPMKRRKKA